MIQLVRAWDPQYTPLVTGGIIRLRRASVFRDLEAGEGILDRYEGQRRRTVEGYVSSSLSNDKEGRDLLRNVPINFRMYHGDQVIDLPDVHPGDSRTYEYDIDVHDDSRREPYILCFSLMPTDDIQWRNLLDSLPASDIMWTVTTDVTRLKLEIECGIKHWIVVNGISTHKIRSTWGKVDYLTQDKPVPQTPKQLLDPGDMLIGRWFRKVRKYVHQREYRFAFIVESDEIPEYPPHIDIELTKSGIALFESYEIPISGQL